MADEIIGTGRNLPPSQPKDISEKAIIDRIRLQGEAFKKEQEGIKALKDRIEVLKKEGKSLEDMSDELKVSTDMIQKFGSTTVRSVGDLTKIPLDRAFRDWRSGLLNFEFGMKSALGAMGVVAWKTFEYWDKSKEQVRSTLLPLQQQLGLSVASVGGANREQFFGNVTRGAKFGFTPEEVARSFSGLSSGVNKSTMRTISGNMFDSGATAGTLSYLERQAQNYSVVRGVPLERSTQLVSDIFQRTGRNLSEFDKSWNDFLGSQARSTLSADNFTEAVLSAYTSLYKLTGSSSALSEAIKKTADFSVAIRRGLMAPGEVGGVTEQTFFNRPMGGMVGMMQLASRMGVRGGGQGDPFSMLGGLATGKVSGLSVREQIAVFDKLANQLGYTGDRLEGFRFAFLKQFTNLPVPTEPSKYREFMRGALGEVAPGEGGLYTTQASIPAKSLLEVEAVQLDSTKGLITQSKALFDVFKAGTGVTGSFIDGLKGVSNILRDIKNTSGGGMGGAIKSPPPSSP